jgi:hypothetical protein
MEMSDRDSKPGGGARAIGKVLMVLGVLVLVTGLAVYLGIGAQLKAERIPINGDTPFMNSVFGSGEGETPKEVRGPLGAIAQAEGIKAHTENIPGSFGFAEYNGLTAGEIAHIRSAKDYNGAGNDQTDSKMTALWNMMNTSSFLRSSLMLSAMAFGVAALVAGLGLVVFLAGLGLLSAGRGLAAQRPSMRQVTEVVTGGGDPVLVNTSPPAGGSLGEN